MKPENLTCPKCGGRMVSRTNSRDGSRFWGCADYPTCNGTRNTDGEVPTRENSQRVTPREFDDRLPSERQRERDRRRWR